MSPYNYPFLGLITYPLTIPHERVRILYIRIHNYSSIEENIILKERGMFGPYNIIDSPITIVIVSLIVIFVPLLSPLCPIEAHYFYCCALILLFLCQI